MSKRHGWEPTRAMSYSPHRNNDIIKNVFQPGGSDDPFPQQVTGVLLKTKAPPTHDKHHNASITTIVTQNAQA